MVETPETLSVADLRSSVESVFAAAQDKVARLDRSWDPASGAPVFTVEGQYQSRGWTEWTQGFQFGCQLLVFDGTDDARFLEMGRTNTVAHMAAHVTHTGVHDHGFNNVSTYGNLHRLIREERIAGSPDALRFYELALKASGAVQAARWSNVHDGTGYIYSFNGPHSLFSDTIRSCRSLVLAHQLGQVLMGENDVRISLLQRASEHIENTARYNVYYGAGRDAYDVRGRTAHESLFNTTDGRYRCPSTQQGYSPFTTWTRGLAWIILGAAEHLEFFRDRKEEGDGEYREIISTLLKMGEATADFYIGQTPPDGIPYWDTGAPGLAQLPNALAHAADPDNPHEPVDSSAAAIAAQGLLRLGNVLGAETEAGARYHQAGLRVAQTLMQAPYLSQDSEHQGLLLHAVYHRPNGWDHVPDGKQVPHGESCLWGDYHLLALAVYLQRAAAEGPYPTFFIQREQQEQVDALRASDL
jgi:unsaturated chondroitin disaccharide hydrolase